jgi:CAI-1 autoinducer synthase
MQEALEQVILTTTKKHLALHPEIEQRIISHYQRCYVGEDRSDHILVGKTPQKNSIKLNNNDYLCLSGEKSLVEASINAIKNSRTDLLMSGTFLINENQTCYTESQIASYLHAKEGILCQSGWIANVGLIQTISSPNIPVYLDMQAHGSIWEGVLAARAPYFPFKHNDIDHLERLLRKNGPGVVAVDSVYSTDGSLCPLNDLVNLAERYNCTIVVDESHSVGTHGPQGAGLVVQHNLQDRVHFRTFSLSKAFAGRGGFITCPEGFKTYFIGESRPAIFSTSLLNHELGHFNAATTFLKSADKRRSQLLSNSTYLRNALADLGYPVKNGTEQIISLESGPENRTRVLRDALQSRNIFGSGFGSPATPKNRSLIRFTLNSSLTLDQLNDVIAACEEIRDQVDVKNWESTKRQLRCN